MKELPRDEQVRAYLTNIGYDVDMLLKNKNQLYRSFYIPKKIGFRRIEEPNPELKAAQRSILSYLETEGPHPSEYAMAFKKGRGPGRNGSEHKRTAVVLCLDVKDFFPSISDHMVERTFKSKIIAELCTRYGRLGQGIPTSPFISNVVARRMDYEIAGWCKKQDPELKYTRYADDITISCYEKVCMSDAKRVICAIMKKHDFRPNYDKIRIRRPHQRMLVTGVVVNDFQGTPRPYRRKLRAELHNALIRAEFGKEVTPEEVNRLRGKVAWVNSVNTLQGEKLNKQFRELHATLKK